MLKEWYKFRIILFKLCIKIFSKILKNLLKILIFFFCFAYNATVNLRKVVNIYKGISRGQREWTTPDGTGGRWTERPYNPARLYIISVKLVHVFTSKRTLRAILGFFFIYIWRVAQYFLTVLHIINWFRQKLLLFFLTKGGLMLFLKKKKVSKDDIKERTRIQ